MQLCTSGFQGSFAPVNMCVASALHQLVCSFAPAASGTALHKAQPWPSKRKQSRQQSHFKILKPTPFHTMQQPATYTSDALLWQPCSSTSGAMCVRVPCHTELMCVSWWSILNDSPKSCDEDSAEGSQQKRLKHKAIHIQPVELYLCNGMQVA